MGKRGLQRISEKQNKLMEGRDREKHDHFQEMGRSTTNFGNAM